MANTTTNKRSHNIAPLIAGGIMGLGVVAGGYAAGSIRAGDREARQEFIESSTAYGELRSVYPGARSFVLPEADNSSIGTLTFEVNGAQCISIVRKLRAGDEISRGAVLLDDNLVIHSTPKAACVITGR